MYGRIANARSALNVIKWRATRVIREVGNTTTLARCCSAGRFTLEHNLSPSDKFPHRHIGPEPPEQKEMLRTLGLEVSDLLFS